MAIEWREDLCTGMEQIDNQHREIFVRFALFSDACTEGRGAEELMPLLDFLSGYTAEHFREETAKMSDTGYPGLAGQHTAHAGFLKDFERLKDLVDERGPDRDAIMMTKRAMIQWLINHIRQMDKTFAEFLATSRR